MIKRDDRVTSCNVSKQKWNCMITLCVCMCNNVSILIIFYLITLLQGRIISFFLALFCVPLRRLFVKQEWELVFFIIYYVNWNNMSMYNISGRLVEELKKIYRIFSRHLPFMKSKLGGHLTGTVISCLFVISKLSVNSSGFFSVVVVVGIQVDGSKKWKLEIFAFSFTFLNASCIFCRKVAGSSVVVVVVVNCPWERYVNTTSTKKQRWRI